MFQRTKLSASLLVAFGGSALLFAAAANAQSTDEVQRITVTGSNIKRTDAETASPIQVISRDEIQASGKTTVAEVVLSLNGNNNGSVPLSFSNGFAAGATGASLRGLGANSTLVLLNGRRMAPYGLADDGQRTFVDLSTIPLEAVDRVEVVKDGASAIYGSDAIAGVVNIITRSDYKGIGVNVSYGETRYGDGKNPKGSITAGFGDMGTNGYNVFMTLEAQHIGEIKQGDRYSRNGIGDPDATKYGYDFTLGNYRGYMLNGTTVSASPVGWARRATGPNGGVTGSYQQLAVPASGCFTPQVVTDQGYSGCIWNTLDYLDLQPKEDKINFLTRGTFNLGNSLTAFGEIGIFKSKVDTHYTPTSVSGSWADPVGGAIKNNSTITMGPNHPDNPFAGSYARLRYVTADLGGRDNQYDTTVSRLVAGLQGSTIGWDWETGVLYTESKTDQISNGYVRDSVLRDYLNGTNLSGQNPNLLYYRLGANASLNSAETREAIAPTLSNSSKTSITSIDMKASKELAKLAGGAMSLALGAELRREKVDSPPRPFTYEADIIGLGYSGFSGSRDVKALYAELVAPVLSSLELSAAARTDRYSDYGRSSTPKVGFKWSPSRVVMVRGTYAEGFRAPGAAESGKSVGGSAGYTNVVDPVRCPGGTPAPGATEADCDSQVLAISTANPFVKPEKSKSYTLGFVVEPMRGFSVSADYWFIKRTNEILGADPATVLANPAGFPSAKVTRSTGDELAGIPNSGTLISIEAPYTNGPSTRTSGFDIDLRHRFAVPEVGKFSAALTWTHVYQFDRTLTDGNTYKYSGTYGPTSLSSSSGMPKDKATLALSVEHDALRLTGTVNYIGAIRNVEYLGDPNGCLGTDLNGNQAPKGCRTPSFTTFDVGGSYTVSKGFEVYGAITNLFDREAPYDLTAFYGGTHYNASYHSAGGIGRAFNIGMKYKFQ